MTDPTDKGNSSKMKRVGEVNKTSYRSLIKEESDLIGEKVYHKFVDSESRKEVWYEGVILGMR